MAWVAWVGTRSISEASVALRTPIVLVLALQRRFVGRVEAASIDLVHLLRNLLLLRRGSLLRTATKAAVICVKGDSKRNPKQTLYETLNKL